MKILTDISSTYSIDSITQPSPYSHYWLLDAKDQDFRLEEFQYLEEITGPVVKLRIDNNDVLIPATWHVVVIDKESSAIDSVPVTSVAALHHDMLLFSPHDSTISTTTPIFLDLFEQVMVYPTVPKACAFVCPVTFRKKHGDTRNYGILVGPYDLGRWIDGKTAGDILC